MAIDPAELRRRNLLRRDEMPYSSPTGMPYDHMDPLETLEQALAVLDYDAFRKEQAAARGAGPLPGRRHLLLRRADGAGVRRLRDRGRDHPDRAVGEGQRLRGRRLDRQQPGDDGGAADRRRARGRHRRRAHDPGRHGGHAVRRGHRRQPQRLDDRRGRRGHGGGTAGQAHQDGRAQAGGERGRHRAGAQPGVR